MSKFKIIWWQGVQCAWLQWEGSQRCIRWMCENKTDQQCSPARSRRWPLSRGWCIYTTHMRAISTTSMYLFAECFLFCRPDSSASAVGPISYSGIGMLCPEYVAPATPLPSELLFLRQLSVHSSSPTVSNYEKQMCANSENSNPKSSILASTAAALSSSDASSAKGSISSK